MKNLIPKFIIEQFEKKCFKGELQAFTMFIDISGFTSMTETLMKHGKIGAEILADILDNLFTPAIISVYENGGFITTFAGDAFTAIFPKEKLMQNKFFFQLKKFKSFLTQTIHTNLYLANSNSG